MERDELQTQRERHLPPPKHSPRLPYPERLQLVQQGQPLTFAAFRAISPLIIPCALGGSTYTLLAILTINASSTAGVGPDALIPLFFIFAAVAVIIGTAMAYAPNETIWALAMMVGLIIDVALTTWALSGIVIAIALLFSISTLLIVIVRRQLHTVLEHTVHVMILFGKYNRTIYPGFNLRLPWEQLWAIVPTADITLDAQIQNVTLADGRQVTCRVSASCHVVAAKAYLLADHVSEWQRHVQQELELGIVETLTNTEADLWLNANHSLAESRIDPSLAATIRSRTQQSVAKWGISIDTIRVHTLQAALPITPVNNATVAVSVIEPRSFPSPVVPDAVSASAPQLAYHLQLAYHIPPMQPAMAGVPATVMRSVPASVQLPLPATVQPPITAPAALIEAYAAVRERRITDPTTIARIAAAFEQAGKDPLLGPTLPFNAEEAAKNLRTLISTR